MGLIVLALVDGLLMQRLRMKGRFVEDGIVLELKNK